jgi:hypothetical protein
MKTITSFIILVSAAASVLCAAQPPGPSSAAVRASSAPVQVTSGAPQISSAPLQITFAPPRPPQAAAQIDAGAAQSVLVRPLPQVLGTPGGYGGYVHVVRNGQERYCRNDVATGSRTERHTICLTPAQLAAQQARASDYIEKAQKVGGFTGVPVWGMAPQTSGMH